MATSISRYLKISRANSPTASLFNFTGTASQQSIQDSVTRYPSFEEISDQLLLMGEPLSVAQMKLLRTALQSPSQPSTTTQTEMNSSTCYANFSSSKESASPMSTSRSWERWPLNDCESMIFLVFLSCTAAYIILAATLVTENLIRQYQKLESASTFCLIPLSIGVVIFSSVTVLMLITWGFWDHLKIRRSICSGTAKSEKP